MATYQLFGGGINYKSGEESGVLYNLTPQDTDIEVREKIRIAKAIYKVRPHAFKVYNLLEMNALLESLPENEVVNLEVAKPVVISNKKMRKSGKR